MIDPTKKEAIIVKLVENDLKQINVQHNIRYFCKRYDLTYSEVMELFKEAIKIEQEM